MHMLIVSFFLSFFLSFFQILDRHDATIINLYQSNFGPSSNKWCIRRFTYLLQSEVNIKQNVRRWIYLPTWRLGWCQSKFFDAKKSLLSPFEPHNSFFSLLLIDRLWHIGLVVVHQTGDPNLLWVTSTQLTIWNYTWASCECDTADRVVAVGVIHHLYQNR